MTYEDDDAKKIAALRRLGVLLDTKFEGPMGIRFGLDGLIGLIPVIGDLFTTGLSMLILVQGVSLGVTPATLVRMALNIAVDNLIDMIPFIGNILDFVWRSNTRNIALLEAHVLNPRGVRQSSRLLLGTLLLFMLLMTAAAGYVGYLSVRFLYEWIKTGQW